MAMMPTDTRTPENDRECLHCGHVFQTVAQRRHHEILGDRGQEVRCPCGDICWEQEDW